MTEFVKALHSRMAEYQDTPLLEKAPPVDNTRAIEAFKKQQKKIQIAYETTDAYTPEEYAERKRAIQKEIDSLQDAELQQQKHEQEHKQQQEAIAFIFDILPNIETWMEVEPAGEVNVQLSKAVERVSVLDSQTVNVVLR